MKLLFDHNLSPGLVSRLADIYPHSSHLYFLGLDQAIAILNRLRQIKK